MPIFLAHYEVFQMRNVLNFKVKKVCMYSKIMTKRKKNFVW